MTRSGSHFRFSLEKPMDLDVRSRAKHVGWAASLLLLALVSGPAAADPEPGHNMLELGFSGGAFVPSKEHELYDWKVARFSPLSPLGLDLSLRLSYFPFSFIGAEVEGNYMPARTAAGKSAQLFALGGHGVLQIPGQLTPFLLVGGGTIGIASKADALGNDTDRAFHWGAGVKYYFSDRFTFRLDLRHIVSGARGDHAGNTSHFEALMGFSITLFKGEEVKMVEPDQTPIRIVEVAPLPEPVPVPPTPAVETAAQIAIAAEAVETVLNRVHFEFGSSELRSRDHAFLDEAVALLKTHDMLKVQVIGHTDSIGPYGFNMKLSGLRANAVRDYLILHGVPPTRVVTLGLGPDLPAAPNETSRGRAINRRIEFYVVDGSDVRIKMLEPLTDERLSATPDDVLLR